MGSQSPASRASRAPGLIDSAHARSSPACTTARTRSTVTTFSGGLRRAVRVGSRRASERTGIPNATEIPEGNLGKVSRRRWPEIRTWRSPARMLAPGPTSKLRPATRSSHRRTRIIRRVVGQGPIPKANVLNRCSPSPSERDALQESRGNDAIGVDVLTRYVNRAAGHPLDLRQSHRLLLLCMLRCQIRPEHRPRRRERPPRQPSPDSSRSCDRSGSPDGP